jgi:hypothetical protein
MPDEDYSAYLKKQSYDDLVSISYSINRESQAERYKMVLEEIADREKRGEKIESEKAENKWRRPAMLLLGVWLIFESVIGLILSRPTWRVVTDFVLGVVCLLIAWLDRKK